MRPVDAILVLGAAQYQGDPSPVFAGRLEHAQLLFEQGRADRIVVLGAGRTGDASTEAEAGRAYLVGHGVPSDRVVALPEGSTSHESLQAAMPGHGRTRGRRPCNTALDRLATRNV